MENKIVLEDINHLVSQVRYFEPFKNTTFLITGSTGLLGSILIKSLIKYGNIKVFACCRSKSKFVKIFEDYLCDNLIPVYSDILSVDISAFDVDYIVHGASITDSKAFIEKPIETISIAIDGTRNLLKQCINKSIKGFVYLSSLEIYGIFNDVIGVKDVKENEAGFIDCMAIRSSYSEGKRMTENICKAYQSEYDIPVKVVRLCQTFGAGVEYNDNRVFAQFARAIIENKNIVLKTKGETVRNYCYTTDAVSGILTVLAKGESGEAYNIANSETTISIAEMANHFCVIYPDCKSKVVFDIATDASKLGYNPIVKIQLNSSKIIRLGWNPLVSFDDMCKRLIKGMENESNRTIAKI